ncbi:MAG: hypothetical protein FJ297_03370 [Planctomycetes bacterium]|nr:hypothetical protein [Planctomycetota bacterium]
MRSRMACRPVSILVPLLLCAAVSGLAQDWGAGAVFWREARRPGEERAAATIEQALDGVLSADIHDLTLDSLVDFLRDQGLPALLDKHALADAAISGDEPVSFQYSGVQLRSALTIALREQDLTWLVADEVLLITTPEVAEQRPMTRVYFVGSVLRKRSSVNIDGERQLGDGDGVQLGNTAGDGVRRPDYDFAELIEAITSTIAPDTWESVGGSGTIRPLVLRGDAPVLIVSQSYDVQQRISDLIRVLHAPSEAIDGSHARSPMWRDPSEFSRGMGTAKST